MTIMLLLLLLLVFTRIRMHGGKMADAGGMLLGLADSAFANEEELNADWSTNKFGGAPVIIFSLLFHLF